MNKDLHDLTDQANGGVIEESGALPFIKGSYFGVGVLVLFVLYGLGAAVGGEFSSIMLASLQNVPFAILAIFAYLGLTKPSNKVISVAWLFGVVGILALLTLANSFAAVLKDPTAMQQGALPEFIEGGQLQFVLTILGMGVSVLVGCLGFIPSIRCWLSRFLPLDPDNFVHTIALVAAIMLTLVPAVPLIFLGQPPLLAVVTGFAAEGQDFIGRNNAGLLRDQLYALLWLLPASVFAVGYGIKRTLPESLKRLGVTLLSWKQLLFGLGFAVVLVFAVSGLEVAMGWIWETMGWTRTDGEAFGLIVEFALTPLGAVVLGITAGLGEELAVRGVLQPRVGILLSNLVFTSLHALQYNWDGLLVVFLIGLIFGLIRKYSNSTTLCALIHGLYDFIIIMAIVIEVPGFEF